MIQFNIRTRKWDVTCDRCASEYLEVEADDFRAAVRAIQWRNWSVYKEDGEWIHACPDCE